MRASMAGVSSRLIQTKPSSPREPFPQPCRIEIGQHRAELFGGVVDIHDPARFGKERGHANVHGENQAVAVENGGTRSLYRAARHALDAVVHLASAQLHEPPTDQREAEHDEADDDPDPRRGRMLAPLGDAIDLDDCRRPRRGALRQGRPVGGRGGAHL